jgi:hypothetical protein
MKYPIKELQKQLDRLQMERKRLYPGRDRRLYCSLSLDEEERAGLRPGQRIVEDQYEDAKGDLVMTMERITAEPSDIGKCFPFRYWNRKALTSFRELEEYARHNAVEVEGVSWEGRLPLVGGKDGRLLAPSDQPSPVRNDDDPDDDRCGSH